MLMCIGCAADEYLCLWPAAVTHADIPFFRGLFVVSSLHQRPLHLHRLHWAYCGFPPFCRRTHLFAIDISVSCWLASRYHNTHENCSIAILQVASFWQSPHKPETTVVFLTSSSPTLSFDLLLFSRNESLNSMPSIAPYHPPVSISNTSNSFIATPSRSVRCVRRIAGAPDFCI